MKEKERTGAEPEEHGPSSLCTAPVWELSHELLARFLGRGVCRCILTPRLGKNRDSRREPVINWFRLSFDLQGEGGDSAPTQCPCHMTGLGEARRNTYAARKVRMAPAPFTIKPTRSSRSARAIP